MFRLIKVQQAAFKRDREQTQELYDSDMSDKEPRTLQHLCVTCVSAHQAHAELMDSMPLRPLPMDPPP